MEIKGVKLGLGYEGRMVLQDFDIEIRQGEITTFVGPNGSGKSTVLKTLTRLLPCRQGTVLCNGTPLPQIASRAFAQKVGILPQQHLAPPDFSVRQLVSFPMYERMVSAGQKPLMFLQQESPYARIADRIQAQLNQCRLDLEDLAQMDSRLSGLQWLGDLWEEYGLWKHNGYLYHLTEAGQFWEVNMTQTVLECVELLLEGAEKGKVAEARVAEQG